MVTFISNISIFLLLFLSTTTFHISMSSNHRVVRCNQKDRRMLLIFKQGIIDRFGQLSTWSNEEDCCVWKGVQCDNITGRVTKLDLKPHLDEEPLEGEINFSVFELEFLNYLDLSLNDFEAISIPTILDNVTLATSLHYLDISLNIYLQLDNLQWLSHLSSLKYLNLSGIDLLEQTNWLQLVAMLPSLTELRLSGCNLNNISSSVKYVNFTSLVTLDLSYNNFKSELPYWLLNLTSDISYLDLNSCSLQGDIPSGMLNLQNLKHLFYLDLSWNMHLRMDNLHWLSHLSSLKYLNLSGINLHKETNWLELVSMLPSLSELRLSRCKLNNISSPLMYVNFTSLVTLDLSENSFNSDLPNWLFNLSSEISQLDLSKSSIHGEIPLNLLNLRNLRYLSLNQNQLKGTIPDWIGKLEHLQSLDLSSNMFYGSIPSSLGNLSSLVSLSIGANYLSGAISEIFFSRTFNLEYLNLSYSTFFIHFNPKWIPHFQLQSLYLANTNLGPIFPSWIYTQKSLQELDISSSGISFVDGDNFWRFVEGMSYLCLSNNSISGDISNIKLNSVYLILDHNNFTGELPHVSPMVKYVDLSHNSFSGSIPSGWKNLKYLEYINLWSNRLSGEVLPYLSNWVHLTDINLGKNQFSGTIPTKMPYYLEVMILRSNQFEGNIPPQLFDLTSLFHLDLAHNKFSGTISLYVYNNTQMTTDNVDDYSYAIIDLFTKGQDYVYQVNPWRRTIDLSANNLLGEIPLDLFKLIQVQTLNLSHNHLTGTIAKTIGDMKNLESLDLSNNKLYGEIPQSMALLTFLGYLNLSCNNFTGQIPTGAQLQSFNASSYVRNLGLCGAPLKKCISEEENPENAKQPTRNEDDDPFRESLYLGMGVGFAVGFWGICSSLFLVRKWRHIHYQFLNRVTDQLYVSLMVKFRKTRVPTS